MLGIDLYQQYNLVTDWHAVAGAGVKDVYVKLSDGGGPAQVRGDAYITGARSVGLAVGGYHFMQPNPSPEAQAMVFVGELRRLNALDLAPALDWEADTIPTAVRVDYAKRFLWRVKVTLGLPKVALYASASWWIQYSPNADTWNIPGLVDWVAGYGPNDGTEHPLHASVGHVDAHQYSSTGHIPGIVGDVDVSNITGDLSEHPQGVDDMAVITGDWPAGTAQRHYLLCPTGSASSVIARTWLSLGTGWAAATGHVWFIATAAGKADYVHDQDFTLTPNVRTWWALPDGVDQVAVQFDSANPVAWCLETQPRMA